MVFVRVTIQLIDATSTRDTRAFFLNTWPMYVHELSGLGASGYTLDEIGRWQPNVASNWLAPITPSVNLRIVKSAIAAQQPYQRAHLILRESRPIGFACVGLNPFKYMPEHCDRCIGEFFLIHGERAQGIGQQALTAILQHYPAGTWYLRALYGNARAVRFWSKALPAVGALAVEQGSDGEAVTFSFLYGSRQSAR